MKTIKNKKNKNFLLAAAFALFVLLMLSSADAYRRTSPQILQSQSSVFASYSESSLEFNEKMCQEGQDFIIQIAPFGCEPAVVRQDLLEEQNVPVFCQLAATKVNPLIDVNAINSLSFSGQYPKEIAGVGFQPSQAALSTKETLNRPVLDNIGYAVIVLKQQENASALPDYVEGNLTVKIKYDIKNAFGIGKAVYYLPLLRDEEWNEEQHKYQFWNGKGYLRLEDISGDSAVVSVYDKNKKIDSVKIKKGETSRKIRIPGFNCLASLKLKLEDLKESEEKAKLFVGDDYVEVPDGGTFLEGKCRVSGLEKIGIISRANIICENDDTENLEKYSSKFSLFISPKINLSVEGKGKDYEIGEKIFSTSGKDAKDYFLGLATSRDGSEKNLKVLILGIPAGKKERLSDEDIKSLYHLVKRYDSFKKENEKFTIKDAILSIGKFGTAYLTELFNFIRDRETFFIEFSKSEKVSGREIKVIGFSEAKNRELSKDIKNNYVSALNDFDSVIQNYKEEDCSGVKCSEKAFYEKIITAYSLEQYKDVLEFCRDFERENSDSELYSRLKDSFCKKNAKLSSESPSSAYVHANGKLRRISFSGVDEPGFEDYGAVVFVKTPSGETMNLHLEKGIPAGNLGGDYVELVDLKENAAKIKISLKSENFKEKVKGFFKDTITLKLNEPEFAGEYVFTLKKVNLKKQAKVSVIPMIHNVGSASNFSFKIGIEKRSIQLSPETTQRIIKDLNRSIEKWEEISAKLGNFTENMKKACLGVGTALIVKNFFANLGGRGIARNRVMRGSNGWMQRCSEKVKKGEYSSVNECLIKNSKSIEKDVEDYTRVLEEQNNRIKSFQEESTLKKGGLFSEDIVDSEKFKEKYIESLKNEFKGNKDYQKLLEEYEKNIDKISSEDLRELDINYRLSKLNENDNSVIKELAESNLNKKITELKDNLKQIEEINKVSKELQNTLVNLDSKGKKTVPLKTTETTINGKKEKIQAVRYNNQIYYLSFKKQEGDYVLDKVYEKDDSGYKEARYSIKEDINKKFSFEQDAYSNSIKNPEVRYFGASAGPAFEGKPSIVPFDIKNGWYAAVKPVFSGVLRGYDKSGKLNNFYLCNVGSNNRIDFFSNNFGDDTCRMVNLATGQPYDQFPGLGKEESSKLIQKAIKAVETATKQYKKGTDQVKIFDQVLKVGESAAAVSGFQCQDFMSPRDCQILFNVCDPVICPSSRCDFGGSYPVDDVIQTGVIGGMFLCLPNWNEGVYIPLCVSGISAGVDGFLSVQRAYRDCLQESLDTGRMIGICDEIFSVSMCELFWRQAVPLMDRLIPGILERVFFGGVARGGGEYLGVQNAWANAKKSFNFFTSYYAAASYKAFKARTMEEIGGFICKSFISGTGPDFSNMLDSLTEPDSPPQFHGRIEEIPFTTATNPPTSHYKVFYHIYAGKKGRAYYKVYLKTGKEELLSLGSTRFVSQGYIPTGEYVSETKDFTAPSGYNQLCINVNGQEECGFKSVSTSFALNYVSDQYKKQQLTKKEITSEKECISGSVTPLTFLTPSVGGAVEEAINPQIYNYGITRVCSTENPGKGSDPYAGTEDSRWVEVGYCGDKGMKCWLDTSTVKDIIKDSAVENESLESLKENTLEILEKQGKWINPEDFQGEYDRIKNIPDLNEQIKEIDSLLEKVYYNRHKAELLLLRGEAYRRMAWFYFEPKKNTGFLFFKPVKKEFKNNYGIFKFDSQIFYRSEDSTLEIPLNIYKEGNILYVLRKGEKEDYVVFDINNLQNTFDAAADHLKPVIKALIKAGLTPEGKLYLRASFSKEEIKAMKDFYKKFKLPEKEISLESIVFDELSDHAIRLLENGGSVTIHKDFDINDISLIPKSFKGELIIEGNIEEDVGKEMKEGKIIIIGNVKGNIGEEMKGGEIIVKGSVEGNIGERMKGGKIIIDSRKKVGFNLNEKISNIEVFLLIKGNIGEEMKGGEITINGNVRNDLIGYRMKEGKIIIEGEVVSLKIGYGMRGGEITIVGDNIKGNIGEKMEEGEISIEGKDDIEGDVGKEMKEGKIIIIGKVKGNIGEKMEEGEISIEGKDNIEGDVGKEMKSGTVFIKENIKGNIGFSMVGGAMKIEGNIEGDVGKEMKEGKIVIIGKVKGNIETSTEKREILHYVKN